MFKKIASVNDLKIEKIYHMSDIHIRDTDRHTEYIQIFNECYDVLKKSAEICNILIVITGDIMHTKKPSPDANVLAQSFFKNLSSIAPTIVIPGNHDCNLSNADRSDALGPVLGLWPNLFYLKESGFYAYNNIVFGVTSVYDKNILQFNSKVINRYKKAVDNIYTIALYHGIVNKSTDDIGYRFSSNVSVDDFEGYDYVLLGDIHKWQYLNKTNTIAYAGSLIQQSYGESIDNHGMIEWDLVGSKSNFIPIVNSYGFYTLEIRQGKYDIVTFCPKPSIRFKLIDTTELKFQEILQSIKSMYDVQTISCETIKNNKNLSHNKKLEIKTGQTQSNLIYDYVASTYGNETALKIVDLHKKIEKKIDCDVVPTPHTQNGTTWSLVKLQFSNMLSYGSNNVIDFTTYSKNEVIGIFANNDHGKSAILDIILYCLFEKFTRGELNQIINQDEGEMYCCLEFNMNDKTYCIERSGTKLLAGHNFVADVNFYELDKLGRKINMNGINKKDTNNKISELIGNYRDYLTTYFYLQDKNTNFTTMTQLQKKEYLNEIFKLNIFDQCFAFAKDKIKKISTKIKTLDQVLNFDQLDTIKKSIVSNKQRINVLEDINRKNNELINIVSCLLNIKPTQPVSLLIDDNTITSTDDNYLTKLYNDLVQEYQQLNLSVSTNADFSLIQNVQNEYAILSAQHSYLLTEFNELNNINTTKLNQLLKYKKSLIDKLLPVMHINKSTESICHLQESLDIILNKIQEIEENDLEHQIYDIRERISEIKDCIKPENKFTNMMDMKKIIHDTTTYYLYKINTKDQCDRSACIYGISLINDFCDYLKNLNNNTTDEIIIQNNNDKIIYYRTTLNQLESTLDVLNIDHINPRENIKMYIRHALNNMVYVNNRHWQSLLVDLQNELEHKLSINDELIKLKMDQQMIQHKIKINQELSQQLITNEKNIQSNNDINKMVNDIDNQIEQIELDTNAKRTNLEEITIKLEELGNIINKSKFILNKLESFGTTIFNVEIYRMNALKYNIMNRVYTRVVSNISKLKTINESNDREISQRTISNEMGLQEINKKIKLHEKHDMLSTSLNLYNIYTSTVHSNGLPYAILKTRLPQIENVINNILTSLVNFTIRFVYHDENDETRKSDKNTKQDTVNLNFLICKNNKKPCYINTACGFEKFIINIAFRLALSQLSLNPKPNIFVIDEGWNCLDTENRANIDITLNYIKSRFDHLIIISHLDELKDRANHIISIAKMPPTNYSYIQKN